MEKNKYWLKFVLYGKAEDYLKYSAEKSLKEKKVDDYSFYDRCAGDKSQQYRG